MYPKVHRPFPKYLRHLQEYHLTQELAMTELQPLNLREIVQMILALLRQQLLNSKDTTLHLYFHLVLDP